MDDVTINDPAPDTASEELLIAALVLALKDAPGVVVRVVPDVQSIQQPTAKAA